MRIWLLQCETTVSWMNGRVAESIPSGNMLKGRGVA